MRPADRAWLGLFIAVTVYEIAASRKGWELLSEAADRYRAANPGLTDAGILYVAAHLLRRWPQRADPLAALAKLVGR